MDLENEEELRQEFKKMDVNDDKTLDEREF